MSMQNGLNFIARAVEVRGRLLRVEADREGAAPRQILLTFDIGRFLIRPTEDGLLIESIEAREGMPAGLQAVHEEEPWWRILGEPLTEAGPASRDEDEDVEAAPTRALWGLKMRFREDGDHSRVVLLESTGSAIRTSLESGNGST